MPTDKEPPHVDLVLDGSYYIFADDGVYKYYGHDIIELLNQSKTEINETEGECNA